MKQISLLVACSALLILSSCSLFHKGHKPASGSNAPATAQPAGDKKDGQAAATADGSVTPSDAQQEAARRLLDGGDQSTSGTPGAATTASSTPGRGIRMGTLAPPEEAASSAESNEPGPNSVDRHGLRSPSLPKGLPMNPDGKLNSESSN